MQSARHVKDADVRLSAHHPRYREEHWLHRNSWHTHMQHCGGHSTSYSASSGKSCLDSLFPIFSLLFSLPIQKDLHLCHFTLYCFYCGIHHSQSNGSFSVWIFLGPSAASDVLFFVTIMTNGMGA